MKNITTLLLTSMLLASCGNSDIENYAREKCHECGVYDEDIKSIQVEKTDSVLSDVTISFNQVRLAKASNEYNEGIITKQQFEEIIDEDWQNTEDVIHSLLYGSVVNDSLKKLDKYATDWREAYEVTVIMNSGVTKTFKVITDVDGTPHKTFGELEKELSKHTEKLADMKYHK